MKEYITTHKFKAERITLENYKSFPGIRYYRVDPTGKTQGHFVFDSNLNMSSALCRIVLPGEWVIYPNDGSIKSMSDTEFINTFIPVDMLEKT